MNEWKKRFCIIHDERSKYDSSEHLIRPQSCESWATPLEVARNDAFLKIAGTIDIQKGDVLESFYNTNSPGAFTLKRDFDSLKR